MSIQNYRNRHRSSRVVMFTNQNLPQTRAQAEQDKENMSSSNDSRWWEFYVVRYAMGTVIGALIVYYIFSTNVHLRELLFLPKDLANFGTSHLTLLSVYGLVYCYIASSPILVLHTGRAFLWDALSEDREGVIRRILVVLVIPMLIGAIYLCRYFYEKSEMAFLQASAITVFLMTFLLQIEVLVGAFSKKAERTTEYYLSLTRNREREEMHSFVESYRHLREHGNAFLIVLFEFWLGFVILFFTNTSSMMGGIFDPTQAVRNLMVIILLWIFPACLVWFFGNRLESHLAHMKFNDKQQS